ncbi:MAG: hypothetical protein ACJAZO_005333 [Myxococcota bacterium]|jgi:hypothetical protein
MFDRVEFWTVRRQVQYCSSERLNCAPDPLHSMDAQVVQHYDVFGVETGSHMVFDVLQHPWTV